jgi:hypothetical protein
MKIWILTGTQEIDDPLQRLCKALHAAPEHVHKNLKALQLENGHRRVRRRLDLKPR